MNGFFDHNATTPLSPRARGAWLEAQAASWENPSSLYREAGAVRRRLEDAREAFGEIIGCDSRRIVFNSGATEGCNAVIAHTARTSPGVVAISAIEHPCVREAARKWFAAERIVELAVDPSGVVDLGAARETIASARPALVAVMAANNETGVLQPWRELAAMCREQRVPYHCDAAQWTGKLPSSNLGTCDWVTVSGHKFGGPKGVGLLVVPEDANSPLALHAGGPQESGHRGGTESYADISAMLAALQHQPEAAEPTSRDAFETALLEAIPGTRLLGAEARRLPNTSMVVMPAHPNLKWLTRLSERGFAVSTGSACSAGNANPSQVMAAIGLEPDAMGRVLRFSSGPTTTPGDWQALGRALKDVWAALQSGRRTATKLKLENL